MTVPICKFQSCLKPSKNAGWCWAHYCRLRRHGDPGISTRDMGPNEFVIDGSTVRIKLQYKGSILWGLVDAEDFDKHDLRRRRWWQYEDAARLLGISENDAADIAHAADVTSIKDSHRAALRAKLLKACGLEAT